MIGNCERVIFSRKSFLSIVAETYEKTPVETGGILLGNTVDDIWYIIESIDPGSRAICTPSYFEYEHSYVNHLANKIARCYKNNIELLGLWHRHPGSMDVFSTLDNITNAEFASLRSRGAISGLVNIDPDFRFTMYHVSVHDRKFVDYRKVPIEVNDDLVPEDLFILKAPEDFYKKTSVFNNPPEVNCKLSEQKQLQSKNPINFLYEAVSSFTGGNTQKTEEKKYSLGRDDVEDIKRSLLINRQEILLDMLDNEMLYLEAQTVYACNVQMTEKKIIISMESKQNLPYYPHRISCVLGLTTKNEQCTSINGDTYKYFPGIIKDYIDQYVSNIVRKNDLGGDFYGRFS